MAPSTSQATGEPGDWQALAKVINERMEALDITPGELVDLTGLTHTTLLAIRGGEGRRYNVKTVRAVESALRWERGSIRSVLAGGNPTERGRRGGSDEKPEEPEAIRVLKSYLDKLPPAEAVTILEGLLRERRHGTDRADA